MTICRCMDDDDFRRVRPSNHKAHGEATALLAGDALMMLALDTLTWTLRRTSLTLGISSGRALDASAWASGARGVIGGQAAESGLGAASGLEQLERMHAMKTWARSFSASLLIPIWTPLVVSKIGAQSEQGSIHRAVRRGVGPGVSKPPPDDLEDAEKEPSPCPRASFTTCPPRKRAARLSRGSAQPRAASGMPGEPSPRTSFRPSPPKSARASIKASKRTQAHHEEESRESKNPALQSPFRFLFVTDPWPTLDHPKDTTLRLAEEALALGAEAYICDLRTLRWDHDCVLLDARQFLQIDPGRLEEVLQARGPEPTSPAEFHSVHYRTDPPVDLHAFHYLAPASSCFLMGLGGQRASSLRQPRPAPVHGQRKAGGVDAHRAHALHLGRQRMGEAPGVRPRGGRRTVLQAAASELKARRSIEEEAA